MQKEKKREKKQSVFTDSFTSANPSKDCYHKQDAICLLHLYCFPVINAPSLGYWMHFSFSCRRLALGGKRGFDEENGRVRQKENGSQGGERNGIMSVEDKWMIFGLPRRRVRRLYWQRNCSSDCSLDQVLKKKDGKTKPVRYHKFEEEQQELKCILLRRQVTAFMTLNGHTS